MRVRVTFTKEAAEDAAFRNRPLTLGVLVAPLGGLTGGLAGHALYPFVIGDLNGILVFGLLFGTFFALPVTAILFPLLHSARPHPAAYPMAGAIGGYTIYAALSPILAIPAVAGGIVTGLVFAAVNRGKPSPPDAAPSETPEPP